MHATVGCTGQLTGKVTSPINSTKIASRNLVERQLTMNDEEKIRWKEHRERLGKALHFSDFHQVYSAVVWGACSYVRPTAAGKPVERWNLEKLRNLINDRFDGLCDDHSSSEDYAKAKERLFHALSELAAHPTVVLTEGLPICCPTCRGEFTAAYKEPMVCEYCMKPVLDALDNLIRILTTDPTPEKLRALAGDYYLF